MTSKWSVDKKIEHSKLSSKEDDWNLAGYTGLLSPRRERKEQKFLGDSSSEESEWEEEESDDDTDEEEDISKTPHATRLLMEAEPLRELIERNTKCPKCKGEIEVCFDTVTLATKMILKCKSSECCFISHGEFPTPASLPQFRDNRVRSTDYAVNILYVLSTIVNGNGSAEAGCMLGLLGLPNDTTMSTRMFSIIEDRIAPIVFSLYNDILVENLTEEVRLSFGESNANGFHLWSWALNKSNAIVLEHQNYAKVSASFDMGLQKRGKLHNSPSGHAFLVGKHTRKPSCGDIKSKLCNICQA